MTTVDTPTTAGAMNRYSRQIPLFHPDELAPGDLANISTTADPYWATVAWVGECADDPDAEDMNCDGVCLAVVFLTDDDGAWHVPSGGPLRARLLAEVDQHDIQAQNVAHDDAAVARYATAQTSAKADDAHADAHEEPARGTTAVPRDVDTDADGM